MRIFSASLLSLLATGALLTVAGCGSGSNPGNAGNIASRPRAAPRPAAADNGVSPYMVSAVAANKGTTGAVQVKFELGGRPDVGQPLDVSVVVVPVAGGLDRVSGTFQGDDGLDIVSGGTLAATDKPAVGAPINHQVRVIPRHDGIFALGAMITTEAGGQKNSQKFEMPVIAGNGLPDVPAAAAAQ
jgi:hypothetical protein